ncbi:(Fe-S)-binding protein [Alicyclobacillus tolerans]|uniref:(Fe-S)-binding protein n=1 Tax=Alicyclobacillus tolerans TaxID=90970 RepID=UPI001F22DFF4|nr:(Fe-S)-binding protein [Alicyclobacillus tolerans]MCF8567910.1 (Fe-S)-binding protein [Alicyclobacillus tolerans]
MSETLEQLREEFQYAKTNQCVQCGYCLPVCPTYVTMGKETHSPRGRINLIKMVGEGRITDLSILENPLDLCLGCRACETACPTGVEYGAILESARAALNRRRNESETTQMLKRIFLRKVFPSRSAMRMIGHGMWIYQKSGLQKWAHKVGLTDKLPYHLGAFEATLSDPVSPKERTMLPNRVPAKGTRQYTVAFFTGCIMDAMFQRINRLSIQLLAEAGCDVIVVEEQTCCGALHAHAGEVDQSKDLAKRNIAAFEQEPVDFVVNNAGGCGAMLSEYGHLFQNDPEWHDRALKFAAKTKDISQILALCGGIPVNRTTQQEAPGERVTYQPSCHMTNVQKVTKEPLDLLKSIPGIDFQPMTEANMCCGSAGIYNIVNYEESMTILDRKMEHAKDTKASVIVTTNPGCLIQMKLGIEREKLENVRAVHLIEYLAEAAGIL